ncbi:sugar kinase [Trichocoleus sp. FACHB-591]|uniref:sugar kinase n=1 Tax=Trichocoleus sp. FACHB-591 TaxID=2692872 RepID=UPI0016867457|nr:sugar kinase [Trichocoleus sp. FACHB-591]MBD2097066.1 sugar kinase [Trichocoleus sp. FACHB-591]
MAQRGLFVGMVTLDMVYLAAAPPTNNQKLVASDYTVSAGGPATNAAVAFSALGNQATILGVVGSHPITNLIRADLDSCGVAIADLDPNRTEPPPVSSIITTESTGERAVVSINASKIQMAPDRIPSNILRDVDVVLIDGHQMAVGVAIAQQAKAQNIPVVVDGGSWKPGFEQVLALTDYAICSANFHPPDCHNSAAVFAYLTALGVPQIAITCGGQPIQYSTTDEMGAIAVPPVNVVDTLGAGDIFHGAFCHFILQANFQRALAEAAQVAARSCECFGTRGWLQKS